MKPDSGLMLFRRRALRLNSQGTSFLERFSAGAKLVGQGALPEAVARDLVASSKNAEGVYGIEMDYFNFASDSKKKLLMALGPAIIGLEAGALVKFSVEGIKGLELSEPNDGGEIVSLAKLFDSIIRDAKISSDSKFNFRFCDLGPQDFHTISLALRDVCERDGDVPLKDLNLGGNDLFAGDMGSSEAEREQEQGLEAAVSFSQFISILPCRSQSLKIHLDELTFGSADVARALVGALKHLQKHNAKYINHTNLQLVFSWSDIFEFDRNNEHTELCLTLKRLVNFFKYLKIQAQYVSPQLILTMHAGAKDETPFARLPGDLMYNLYKAANRNLPPLFNAGEFDALRLAGFEPKKEVETDVEIAPEARSQPFSKCSKR